MVDSASEILQHALREYDHMNDDRMQQNLAVMLDKLILLGSTTQLFRSSRPAVLYD